MKENKKLTESKLVKVIKEFYPYVLIIILVILLKTYIIAPIQVNGVSMNSTLKNGDIMLLQKIGYHDSNIKRFDIVVVKKNNSKIIKRVIGLPGDTVEVRDGKLYVNNRHYKEQYLDKDVTTNDFSLMGLFKVKKVPEGQYFVLGDNREESLDSRMLGFIKENEIEGKAIFTIFPFNRFGSKK